MVGNEDRCLACYDSFRTGCHGDVGSTLHRILKATCSILAPATAYFDKFFVVFFRTRLSCLNFCCLWMWMTLQKTTQVHSVTFRRLEWGGRQNFKPVTQWNKQNCVLLLQYWGFWDENWYAGTKMKYIVNEVYDFKTNGAFKKEQNMCTV
jgi:hypothetical protein